MMNKYTFEASMWVDATLSIDLDLKPEYYLDCADEDELWENINEDMKYYLENRIDVTKIYDSETTWSYPEGFLEEWKRLKSNKNEKS